MTQDEFIMMLIDWQKFEARMVFVLCVISVVNGIITIGLGLEIRRLKRSQKDPPSKMLILTLLLIGTIAIACQSISAMKRACVLDDHNRYRMGWLFPERSEGLHQVQLDDDPADGKHIRLLPNCITTLQRPCVLTVCRMVDPFTKPPQELLLEGRR